MQVAGEGPANARVFLVGEGPGHAEELEGRPFVGRSGQLLWQLLWKYAGLNRSDVYVDNLVQERCTKTLSTGEVEDAPPPQEVVDKYGPLLMLKIREMKPSLIVTLGLHSTRYLADRLCMLDPTDIYMESHHGMVITGAPVEYPWVRILPCFHPAAGLHNPNWLKYVAWDLSQIPKCLVGNPTHIGVDSTKPSYFLLDYVGGHTYTPIIAIDTEGTKKNPFCLTYSCGSGHANAIESSSALGLRTFKLFLEESKPRVILHNALWDLEVLRTMGIDILGMGLEIEDTMVAAFNLQVEPMGLKSLAPRHLGIRMTEYKDLIHPYVETEQWGIVEKAHSMVKEQLAFTVRQEEIHLIHKPKKHVSDWTESSVLRALVKSHPLIAAWKSLNSAIKDKAKGKPVDIQSRWKAWSDETKSSILDLVESAWPTDSMGLSLVPEHIWTEYACRDADATFRLWPILKQRLIEENLYRVYRMDMSRLPLVDRMQHVGMTVDTPKVLALKSRLESEIKYSSTMLKTMAKMVGIEDFNPASGDQVADLFYNKLLLGTSKKIKSTKGKTRLATSDDVLIPLKGEHDAVELLLGYRKVAKLLTSYVDPILEQKTSDDCLHPELKITRVVSGRLSGWLLTFPTRDAVGKEIRDCFISNPGHLLGSFDLSQIELRIFAHVSEEKAMLQAFRDGVDIHTRTCEILFNTTEKKWRTITKNINFMILYGGGPPKLKEMTSASGVAFTLKECEDFFRLWFDRFPSAKTYIAESHSRIKSRGYAEDMWGRRRYVPAATLSGYGWPWSNMKEAALREGFSLEIQGGAQGVVERAMSKVWNTLIPYFKKLEIHFDPLLQIHDELIVEFDEKYQELVNDRMLWAMTADSDLFLVPIESSSSFGKRWGDLK